MTQFHQSCTTNVSRNLSRALVDPGRGYGEDDAPSEPLIYPLDQKQTLQKNLPQFRCICLTTKQRNNIDHPGIPLYFTTMSHIQRTRLNSFFFFLHLKVTFFNFFLLHIDQKQPAQLPASKQQCYMQNMNIQQN